jgi:F0F1-type ATP synthase membrane subunit b/b'
MDTVKAIFTQLGVDSSLLPQFILVFCLFLIAKFLFLNHLQFVLENREEKTVKLEGSADEALEKVNRLSMEYKAKVNLANQESMKTLSAKKADIVARYNEQFKKTEREINAFVDQSRQNFEKEVEVNRAQFMREADGLAGDLVKKIVS